MYFAKHVDHQVEEQLWVVSAFEAAIFGSEPTGVWVTFRSSESVIPTGMMLNVFTLI